MRHPSAQIHRLIHSLNKEEKRKVTMHIKGLGKKGATHLKIFKAIDKQEVYEEETLKKMFRATIFSNEKKRLYSLIQETLVVFHNKVDPSQEILAGLQYVRILFNKKLYHDAQKEIYRLKQLAEKNYLFSYVQLINQELLRLENQVFWFANFEDGSFNTFVEQTKTNLSKLNNLYEYSRLKTELHYIFRKKNYTSKNLAYIDQLLKTPVLHSPKKANNPFSKVEFYQIHLIYHSLKGNSEQALEQSLQSLTIFEQELLEISSPEEYFSYLYNAATRALLFRKFDLILNIIDKIDKNNPTLQTRAPSKQIHLIDLKANIYVMTGNIKGGMLLIEEQKEWLEQTSLDKTIIYSCFASICFIACNYEKALFYIEMLLHEKQNKSHLSIKLQAKIIQLLIYIELAEESLLESAIRAFYRQLSLNKKDHLLELSIIKHLKKTLLLNTSEYIPLYQKMYLELEMASKTVGNNKKKLLLISLTWLKSKIQKRPLSEILKESDTL